MHHFSISDGLGDARDSSGRTLLHHSAKNRQKDLTRLLIRQGCDVDAQDNDGMTPLMLAVRNCDDDIVRILLNAKADVYVENKSDRSVLRMAFTAHTFERRILLRLLRCVESNSTDSEQIALRLISAGCPLDRAVALRNTAVVRRMIELGVDVDARNPRLGSTALFRAATECDPKMVKLLLERKANVNAGDAKGFTAVGNLHVCKCNCDMYFGRYREKLEVLRILIDAGANLTSISSAGFFQAWPILQRGSRQTVGMVLRSNVDFTARDRDGMSMLDYLVENSNEGVVEELAPHVRKFDVNAFDAVRMNPLLRAVECGNLGAVKLLLDNGANVNCAEMITGASPLFKCFPATRARDERKLDECAELLLQYGACPQVVTNYEDVPTIFHVGTRTKRLDRVKLVLARLAMMTREGAPLSEIVRLKLEKWEMLKGHFELCRLVLGEKYGSADLFELLTADESVLKVRLNETACLRKLMLLSEDEMIKESHVYYYNILRKRIEKVSSVSNCDSCQCNLPWTVFSKLDIPKMLEMNEKVLARHLRCAECLRNLLHVCYNTDGTSREVSLKKWMVSTIRKTDLQDRAAVGVGKISGGQLGRFHLVTNEILEYMDDESMEVLSRV